MTNVESFYQDQGWETESGHTLDAQLNEDLREVAKEYVSLCRRRVFNFIPESGDEILDMASGPIQYPEYLEYSKNFNKRVCVDLSEKALAAAKEKIAGHGEYFQGDFLNMDLRENRFDCSISLHTIYHIELEKQEQAVRRLLDVTKPGKPVIIVYKNPRELIRLPVKFLKLFRKSHQDSIKLYHDAHDIRWWNRFKDCAEIQIFPWRSFSAKHQSILFPNNSLGAWMFAKLYKFENAFPKFFVKNFKFPMIVLRKKA